MTMIEITDHVDGLARDISQRHEEMLKNKQVAQVLQELNLYPIPDDHLSYLKKNSSPVDIYARLIFETWSQRHINYVTSSEISEALRGNSPGKTSWYFIALLVIVLICVLVFLTR